MKTKFCMAVLVIVAGIGVGTLPQASAELVGEIQIGAIVPISGDLSNLGAENNLANHVAVDDFNAYLENKGAGWYLTLVSEDSHTLPTIALEKTQSLHAKGIKHIIGPETSGNLQSVKGYVDANDMLVISCCSTSPLLAIEGDSIFRTIPDDTNQAVAIAKILERDGIEVVVPVWRQDAWGVGFKDAIHDSFPALGGVVDEGFGYNPENSDFSAEASILADIVQDHVDQRGADKVGVVYVAFGEAVLFFQSAQGHEVLSQVSWFGTGANARDARLIEDPLASEFSTSTDFTTIVVASGQNDVSKHVESSVAEDLGKTPTAYASSSYDAVWLLGLAMEETQSTDVDTLASAIPQVADKHSGALGSVSLNAAGDLAQANYDIWRISDGKWNLFGTYYADSDSITPAMASSMEDVPVEDDAGEAAPAGGGGCLIATAAYGSELAPQVQFLREIRDNTLMSSASGVSFMAWFNQIYYYFSPAIADLERESPMFRDMVRVAITPAVYAMGVMQLADPDSEISVLVFGTLAISAVGGMYAATPCLVIRAVCQKATF